MSPGRSTPTPCERLTVPGPPAVRRPPVAPGPPACKSGSRPEGDDQPPGVEQFSVPLIPKVVEALQRLQARTHLSRTDLVNRAVTLLDFFEAQRDSDRDILIRDNGTQQEYSIRLR